MRLEKKVALITGGGLGVGAAVARKSSIVSGTTLVADGGGRAVELTSRMFAPRSV
jgi:NAD(P)-dependent dehydrogenase (short-subunit alcohol dehydrogenase family)